MDGIVVKPPKEPLIEPYQPEHLDKFFAVLDSDWKVAKTPRQKMLAARDKAVLRLFLDSGLRFQELADLCTRDIDLDEQRVVVRFGKQGKSRLCGFGPQTRKALWRYLSLRPGQVDGDKLWLTEEGRPLTSRGIQEIFRRTFACLLRKAGVDSMTIKDLGRWESLEMVQRYTRSVTFNDALKFYKPPLS